MQRASAFTLISLADQSGLWSAPGNSPKGWCAFAFVYARTCSQPRHVAEDSTLVSKLCANINTRYPRDDGNRLLPFHTSYSIVCVGLMCRSPGWRSLAWMKFSLWHGRHDFQPRDSSVYLCVYICTRYMHIYTQAFQTIPFVIANALDILCDQSACIIPWIRASGATLDVDIALRIKGAMCKWTAMMFSTSRVIPICGNSHAPEWVFSTTMSAKCYFADMVWVLKMSCIPKARTEIECGRAWRRQHDECFVTVARRPIRTQLWYSIRRISSLTGAGLIRAPCAPRWRRRYGRLEFWTGLHAECESVCVLRILRQIENCGAGRFWSNALMKESSYMQHAHQRLRCLLVSWCGMPPSSITSFDHCFESRRNWLMCRMGVANPLCLMSSMCELHYLWWDRRLFPSASSGGTCGPVVVDAWVWLKPRCGISFAAHASILRSRCAISRYLVWTLLKRWLFTLAWSVVTFHVS